MTQKILVTGGTGFIGSHTVVELMTAGYEPVILDNLANSSRKVLGRLAEICGREPAFIQGDVRDATALDAIFQAHKITAVIHFAGLKAVGESVAKPLEYYDNNVAGTACLLKAMQRAGVRHVVFSSSCTVYGEPDTVPIDENSRLTAMSPYGRSKLTCEEMLRDLMRAEPQWRCAILRYFNPVGAHASGRIGEAPNGIPNNLMPFITQVATRKREYLSVFGSDYPTVDGTGVRDYIHVVDLAIGHLAALRYLLDQDKSLTVNLGTGKGVSVLELVGAFERVTGVQIPRKLVDRRPGDVTAVYAEASEMHRLTGWRAERSVDDMCRDSWRWQSANPEGYE